jgi:hypothetical protein
MPIEYNTTRELWKTALIVPVLPENRDPARIAAAVANDVYAMVVVSASDTDADVAAAADAAYSAGATVVLDPESGDYGSACARAVAALPETIEAVVFQGADAVDADSLLAPIRSGVADLVVRQGQKSMFGHPVAGSLRSSRAIRVDALRRLGPMRERGWEWNIEMQLRAVQQALRIVELPCSMRAEKPSSGVLERWRVLLAVIRLWLGRRRNEEARL